MSFFSTVYSRFFIAGVILFCSCSSHPKLSPETADLVDYTKAKLLSSTEPEKACELYTALATREKFILKAAAYVRSLQTCVVTDTTDWSKPVPAWLEKEKQLTHYNNLKTDLERALFVEKNSTYFSSPDKIQIYQKGIASPDLKDEDKLILKTALHNLAPRFMEKPTIKDQFRIVKDYRSVRQFDKAKSYLKKIIDNPKVTIEEKWNAYKEVFLTDRLLKGSKTNQYIQSAKKWAQFLKPEMLSSPAFMQSYLEAQINYARVLWTERGTEPALPVLDATEKILKGKISLHDIYWLRARMFEEKKLHALSVGELEKALLEKSTLWRDREKILWTLAWSYFKEKKFVEAEKHLNTMIDNAETTPFGKFKYLYWRAEAENRRGATDVAQKTWQQICDEDMFGYYSLISHYQLQKPLKSYVVPDFKPQSILPSEDEKIFDALQQVDEIDLATRLLAMNSPDVNKLKTWDAQKVSSFFAMYAKIKDYRYIFSVFNQLPYNLQKEVFLQIPRILFPEVYMTEMKEAFDKTGVEQELVYSIMRQESSFNPEARSPMDAFGLLQILPEVARRVARESKVPFNNYEDLYDEGKNILLGSQLLKKQMTSFDNKFSLYVASYNASSSAVRKWHKRSVENQNDDIMFIEDIPYEETKAYVKLVMRNFIIYKKLKYGDEYKNFPRELLNIN
jgi:soluble lytic murein transglycosylase